GIAGRRVDEYRRFRKQVRMAAGQRCGQVLPKSLRIERAARAREIELLGEAHARLTASRAGRSYQSRERLTTRTTSSITGTSISTPTTVASAAPDWKPNRLMAAATASSKKLLAPIRAEGPAMLCFSPTLRLSQ